MNINDKLIKFIVKEIKTLYPYRFKNPDKRRKYTLKTIIKEVIYILKTGLSYSNYGYENRMPMKAKTLHGYVSMFSTDRVFEKIYINLYSKFFSKQEKTRLKYQYIDSSFILNKNGQKKINNKRKIGRNKFYKNKNGIKLSIICDSIGIPNSVTFAPGNMNDAIIGFTNLAKLHQLSKSAQLKNKPTLMGDKGYDTLNFRKKCIDTNYKPLIDFNKRNTKNENKIKKFTTSQKTLYKKRIKVENCFGWLKQNKRISVILDKNIDTFINFTYLGICLLFTKFYKNNELAKF